jgi:hypothetical protein
VIPELDSLAFCLAHEPPPGQAPPFARRSASRIPGSTIRCQGSPNVAAFPGEGGHDTRPGCSGDSLYLPTRLDAVPPKADSATRSYGGKLRALPAISSGGGGTSGSPGSGTPSGGLSPPLAVSSGFRT